MGDLPTELDRILEYVKGNDLLVELLTSAEYVGELKITECTGEYISDCID